MKFKNVLILFSILFINSIKSCQINDPDVMKFNNILYDRIYYCDNDQDLNLYLKKNNIEMESFSIFDYICCKKKKKYRTTDCHYSIPYKWQYCKFTIYLAKYKEINLLYGDTEPSITDYAFSKDSKYIILSSGYPTKYIIYKKAK